MTALGVMSTRVRRAASYRGLGSAILGGLILSTVFTIFLVPVLLSLWLTLKEDIRTGFRKGPSKPAPVPEEGDASPVHALRGLNPEESPGA